MEKFRLGCAMAALIVVGAHAGGGAPTVNLYADTAPNVFGSPAWPAWWTSAKTDMAASGVFHPDDALSSAALARLIFARIASAVAVQA